MALEEKQSGTFEVPPLARLDIPDGEKPDLFDFLVSQPDPGIDLSPLPEEKAEECTPDEQAEEKNEDEKKVDALAERIRSRAKAAQITPFAMLYSEDEAVYEVFENLFKDENFSDIVYIKGDKDTYYYSDKPMTEYFATISVLVAEKNDPRTAAHAIRGHSKHPGATPVEFFKNYPYFFTADQIEQICETFKTDPDYEDIQTFSLGGMEYFHSTLYLPRGTAVSLVEDSMNREP